MNWIGLIPLLSAIYIFNIPVFVSTIGFWNKLIFNIIPRIMGLVLFLYGLGVMGIINFKGL